MWDWKWTADFLTHWNHLFLICQNGKIYYLNYNTVWRKWQQKDKGREWGSSLPFLFIAPNPLILASAFRWSAACHALAAWWQHRPLAASCHWYFGRVTTQSHMIFTSALFRQRNFTCGALPHAPHSPCCRTPILRSCPRSPTSATGAAEKCPVSVWVSKTIKEIAEEIGVSKQAVFKKMKREPLSTGLQGLTTTVDGRLIVSVDGLVDEPSTKSEEKTAEVDGQNRLYEILERELQAKNL